MVGSILVSAYNYIDSSGSAIQCMIVKNFLKPSICSAVFTQCFLGQKLAGASVGDEPLLLDPEHLHPPAAL